MSTKSSNINISDHLTDNSDPFKDEVSVNNGDILDRLKIGFGYKSDIEIAGFLEVSTNTVSKIRTNKQRLSLKQRLKIMDRLLVIQVRDVLIKISPDSLGKEIHRLSLRGAERLAFNEKGNDEATPHDVALIDLFKAFGNFKNDEALADFLGISDSMITAARKGSQLGPLPRLRILKAINPDANTEQIEQGVQSSEYLLSLINDHIQMQKSCM